ncbi:MAG: tRNA (adenosine(37)-N6)-threonylcarbamoyltransferase complex ATPase subunit type 1 TsaE [Ruminococcaceae bacterium]|nr:tRNA (adenosine(37)-N6)-threonylcarbamoyltransferase complex ATPase subunit type 1 TsaE [Oscillospiraceae bacterium]
MDFPFVIFTESAEKTEEIGEMLSSLMLDDETLPRFVAMYGDLGVGKTAFVRGFCSSLCPTSTVKSPTFALVNEYKCAQNPINIKKVCHFDMYRVTDEDDLYSIGYDDYLRDDYLCIAEWCELIPYALPDERIEVAIEKTEDENKRRITLKLVL